MNLYQPFYNGKIGVVDLTVQSAYSVDFEADAIRRHLVGASMSAFLVSHFEGDSLVFGTGPLTGTFAPASSLLIGTFRSAAYNHLCHVPFMLRTGPELKFSGLDFLVIRGAASHPCAVYAGRGSVAVVALEDKSDRPVPDVLQALKRSMPPFRTAIVTGPAADRGSPFAAASVDAHGSHDKVGLAARMSEKNLKAVVLGGTGGIHYPEDHPALARAVEKMLRADGIRSGKGFKTVVKRLDGGGEAAGPLRGKLGRNRACYHCPTPCMTHASWKRPATKDQEGLLLMDHAGWAALAAKSEEALHLLNRCLELGLDPVAAGHRLEEDRSLREDMGVLESLAGPVSRDEEDHDLPDAAGVDATTFRVLGAGIPALASGSAWSDRAATAMILGICPIFLQLAGRLDRADLLRFLSTDSAEIKALDKILDAQIRTLLAGKIPDAASRV